MSAVAIVGGGWAGLAAGVELADAGIPVTLCESAKQLGGRARCVDWNGLAIDNGQHLMVGAYRETLRLMARIGTLDTLERRNLDLRVPGFRLHLPDIPAPLHLAAGLMKAAGLNWSDKWWRRASCATCRPASSNSTAIRPPQRCCPASTNRPISSPSFGNRFVWPP
jgi:cation diffusion facilitator CzcD-associated flavoprotein CzcO